MKRSPRAVAAVIGAAIVLGLVPAAGASTPDAVPGRAPATTTFVAKVPGTNAFIGIVVGKSSARAYVCDGDKLGEWLDGAVADGVVAIQSDGGATLVAKVKGHTLIGTLALPDNQVIAIKATRAKGKAGLFRKEQTIKGINLLAGWVRLPDGSLRGQTSALGIAKPIELQSPPTTRVINEQVGAGTGSNPGQGSSSLPTCTHFGQLKCTGGPGPPVASPAPPAIAAQIPESPPADAQVHAAPPLAKVRAVSTQRAVSVGIPTTGLDAAACSRLNRALATLADEIEGLGADDPRAIVFRDVFTALRSRAIFSGCQGVIESP